ncbi:sugar phosphate isomerase/epimerase family protein, partial [Butyricicoccus sp.]|uniref:sugar phosphate isomerase/epimerase family protein n=1 Tax=Butyricicoccus sp. TaxID=2049021 RepID=UPI003F1507B8
LSDIRIAREAGFGAVEMAGTKVWDYLEAGRTAAQAKEVLKQYDMKMISINDIAHVERSDDETIARTLKEAHVLSSFARDVDCDCIQLVPLCALEGRPEEEVIDLTAKNIRRICDVGAQYGVRFQLEPVAWSPIHSLRTTKMLIDAVGRDNFGTVIDFWHLWYGAETTPDDVRAFDPSKMYHIHFCDGTRNEPGTVCDETVLRGCYAGEGDIPLHEWVQAVKDAGYDGWWSYELVSAYHWQSDTKEVAGKTKELLDFYVG